MHASMGHLLLLGTGLTTLAALALGLLALVAGSLDGEALNVAVSLHDGQVNSRTDGVGKQQTILSRSSLVSWSMAMTPPWTETAETSGTYWSRRSRSSS